MTLENRRGNFLVCKIWKKNGKKLLPCPDDLEWPIVDKILNGNSHIIGLKRIVLLVDTFKYLEFIEDDEPNKVFDSFRNVVTTRDFRKLVEKSYHNIVLTEMICMFMRNR